MPEKEIWHWVVGYEGLYMVSSLGNVMGVPKKTTYGHMLVQKETPTGSGYYSVCLCKDGIKKHHSVHRLVAQAFIPNLGNKPEVNHKDGNRSNNRVDNLEWTTRSENETHAFRVLGKQPNKPWAGKPRLFARKLTSEQVKAIRKDSRTAREIGREYNVSKTTINNIKKRKIYTEVSDD